MKSHKNTTSNIENAFALLGITSNATKEEAKKAFREKSNLNHPDKPGGSNDSQSKINDAYALVIEHLSNENNVVPVKVQNAIENVNNALVQQHAHLQAIESAGQLKNRKTKYLNILRNVFWSITILTGALTLFGENLLPIIAPENSNDYQFLQKEFSLITFTLGIGGLILQVILKAIQNRIDSYMDYLSDKKACAFELAKIVNYANLKILDAGAIYESINTDGEPEPSSELGIFTVHKEELATILIQKSVEFGLLKPIEEEELKPDTTDRYTIEFKPILFKPKEKPEKETPPVGRKQAIESIIIIAGLFALFGSGSIWLVVYKKSFWAIPTSVITLAFIGGLISGFDDLKKAREKNIP